MNEYMSHLSRQGYSFLPHELENFVCPFEGNVVAVGISIRPEWKNKTQVMAEEIVVQVLDGDDWFRIKDFDTLEEAKGFMTRIPSVVTHEWLNGNGFYG